MGGLDRMATTANEDVFVKGTTEADARMRISADGLPCAALFGNRVPEERLCELS